MAAAAALAPAAVAKEGDSGKDEGPGKVKTRTATATVAGQNSIGTAIATCPKGTKVVSGGFATIPSVFGNPAPHLAGIYESRRLDARSWQVSAGEILTGADQLTAYAYCRDGVGKVKEGVGTVPIALPGRSEAAATAQCPRGTKAISGGFSVPAPNSGRFIYLTVFERLGKRAWTLNGVRSGVDGTVSESVSAYAYCVEDPVSTESRTGSATYAVSTTVDVLGSAQTGTCRKGTTAVGGGFQAPYTQVGNDRSITLVTESRRVARTWLTSGLALGTAGHPLGLTSLAYCG